MPLQDEKSASNYVKVTKIFVSSKSRNANSKGVYDYQITLDSEIQYVIGMEVTGYNFPRNIAPSFIASAPGFTGTNKLDFEIAGPVNTVFTVTWPENQYTYNNVTIPYLSYVQTLQQLMQTAIRDDPNYGYGAPNEAFFTSTSDPNEVTNLTIDGAGVTGFRFLFASGPNRAEASFNAMGYNQVDTALALQQISPGRTNLRPFRFFDINIDRAAEFQPLKRVYASDDVNYGSVKNDLSLTRTRLLSSEPIRVMRDLRVTITLESGIVPPSTEEREHEFTLTVFSLSNEQVVPSWVRQLFVI